MFNRILAATDIVTAGDAPAITAARLARKQGAHLYLLHVMESASTENRRLVRHFETGKEMTADPTYEDTIRHTLTRVYKDAFTDIAHAVKVAAGFPWEEVLRWAKEVDPDLIVLGPHSSRAEENGVVRIVGRVGSTVENIVIRTTCPVMVVNRPADMDRLRFGKVLVTVDFSRSCECAVSFASRLAARFHSRLIVFHMLPVPPYPKYSRSDYKADTEHARQRLTAVCAPYLDGIDHHFLILAGAMPHLEILNRATEQDVDLIIMGSHTKERSGKWYPGSAVERVSYRSACPVMVITDPSVLTRWEGVVTAELREGEDRLIHVFTQDASQTPGEISDKPRR